MAANGAEPDAGAQALHLLSLARDCAARVVGARRLHDREDLAQQTFTDLWITWRTSGAMPGEREARAVASRLAARERKRRQRAARRERILAEGRAPTSRSPVGVPRLCPRLASLRRATPSLSADFDAILLAAATTLAQDRRVLDIDRFGLFTLAYTHGQAVSRIATDLAISPRAVTCRLQRIARRIEDGLIEHLSRELPPDSWRLLSDALSRARGRARTDFFATPGMRGVSDRATASLAALVHHDPRNSLS